MIDTFVRQEIKNKVHKFVTSQKKQQNIIEHFMTGRTLRPDENGLRGSRIYYVKDRFC